MAAEVYDSIHPPDLIQFDGRKSPDSDYSSLQSSPRSSPVPKEFTSSINNNIHTAADHSNNALIHLSPTTERAIPVTSTPQPFDEQDKVIIPVVTNSTTEGSSPNNPIDTDDYVLDDDEDENDPPTLRRSNHPVAEEPRHHSYRNNNVDVRRHTPDSQFVVTPSPSDNFEDLQMVPTDEKFPQQRSPEVDLQNNSFLADSDEQPPTFEDKPAFETPSFTPADRRRADNHDMFASFATATLQAAQEIENLLLGPPGGESKSPSMDDNHSWFASKITMAETPDFGRTTRKQTSASSWEDDVAWSSEQNQTPPDHKMATTASNHNGNSSSNSTTNHHTTTTTNNNNNNNNSVMWWAEQATPMHHNVRSPDISSEATPMQQLGVVVRRTFGAIEEEEDAPADELRRTLSSNTEGPDDEIRRTLSSGSVTAKNKNVPPTSPQSSFHGPANNHHKNSSSSSNFRVMAALGHPNNNNNFEPQSPQFPVHHNPARLPQSPQFPMGRTPNPNNNINGMLPQSPNSLSFGLDGSRGPLTPHSAPDMPRPVPTDPMNGRTVSSTRAAALNICRNRGSFKQQQQQQLQSKYLQARRLEKQSSEPADDEEEPPRMSISNFDQQPLDEWKQDRTGPKSPLGQQPPPKKVLAPPPVQPTRERPNVRSRFQAPPKVSTDYSSRGLFLPGDPPPAAAQEPSMALRESLSGQSPIKDSGSNHSRLGSKTNKKSSKKKPRQDQDGYASDGTDELIGSLKVMMSDLDNMAQERGINPDSAKSSPQPPAYQRSSQGTADTEEPVRINALNNDLGIPRGDVLISLLHDDDDKRTWTTRVHEAVWRCRTVRRNCDTAWIQGKVLHQQGSPGRGRTSVMVDADDVRVIGQNITETQGAAVQHLKYDELDDAIDLYEDILERYLTRRAEMLSSSRERGDMMELEVSIGTAQYNLGIIYMLRGKFNVAMDLLEHASNSLSFDSIVDELTIRNKIALCMIAQEDFKQARSILIETYRLARERNGSLPDRRQCAEILNSLGCIAYILKEPQKAMNIFGQSLDIQLSLANDALYLGSKFSSHSSAMNVAVVRANVGFLALLGRDIATARVALESSLKSQALLLRDAHFTLISTMEHLAVVHLFDNGREKALQLLRRVLHMQMDAFGRGDRRCLLSRNKIRMIEDSEGRLEAALRAIPDLTNYKGNFREPTTKDRKPFWGFVTTLQRISKQQGRTLTRST